MSFQSITRLKGRFLTSTGNILLASHQHHSRVPNCSHCLSPADMVYGVGLSVHTYIHTHICCDRQCPPDQLVNDAGSGTSSAMEHDLVASSACLQNMNVPGTMKIGSLSTMGLNCLTRDRRGDLLDLQRHSLQMNSLIRLKIHPRYRKALS